MNRVPLFSDGMSATRREFLTASAAVALMAFCSENVLADGEETIPQFNDVLLGRTDLAVVPIRGGKLLLIGGNRNGPLSDCWMFDIGARSWSNKASMHQARMNHTAVVLPTGRILVAGGWNNDPLSSCEIYNPTDDTWTDAAPMNVARTMACGAGLSFGALVTGGLAFAAISVTELYDPLADQWSLLTPLDMARFAAGACSYGNGIIVAGGATRRRGRDYLATTEVFEIGRGVWEPGPTLPIGIAGLAMVNHQGSPLIVGGQSATELLATTFRLSNGDWVTLNSPDLATYSLGLAATPDGRAIAIAGAGSESFTSLVRVYNPSTNQWKTIA